MSASGVCEICETESGHGHLLHGRWPSCICYDCLDEAYAASAHASRVVGTEESLMPVESLDAFYLNSVTLCGVVGKFGVKVSEKTALIMASATPATPVPGGST